MIALVPTVIYIDASAQAWLFAMIAFTLIAQGIVTLRTLNRAITSYECLRRMTGNLDLLILTGVPSRRVVIGQWIAVIRASIIEYALLIPLRLGLALALAHYFHVSMLGSCFTPLTPFCYYSHNGSFDLILWQPILIQVLLAGGVIVLFSVAELALTSAIGIAITMSPIRSRIGWLIGALLMRLMWPVLAVMIISPWIDDTYYGVRFTRYLLTDLVCYNFQGEFAGAEWDAQNANFVTCNTLIAENNRYRIWDTVYVAQFTLADSGLMLAANLLRPNLSHTYRMDQFDFHYSRQVYYTNHRSNTNRMWGYSYIQFDISAWRFIARMGLSAGIGLALYLLITAILLYSADRLSVRRGFSG
ncbi:MAG: hypothetical protein MUF87_16150 [Anaerolineae bacterium]|jgi:hypothetical protein|nr:hypothetical protein [Anaerolineae bacterium]